MTNTTQPSELPEWLDRRSVPSRIAEHYVNLLCTGEIGPGQRVPGRKQIAETWQVSTSSADRALNELAADGYVFRIKGDATYAGKLGATALRTLRNHGITPARWARLNYDASGRWSGDVCGCPDDRCADGYHHMGISDCGCLPSLLGSLSDVLIGDWTVGTFDQTELQAMIANQASGGLDQ